MKSYLSALLLISFSALVCAEDFHLTESGRPVAQILLESEEDKDISEQIDRFNFYLRKITGTELPVGENQLSNIIRILNVKGGSLGVFTRIGVEQIRRITSQVSMICSANGRKRIPSELNEDSETSDMILSEIGRAHV